MENQSQAENNDNKNQLVIYFPPNHAEHENAVIASSPKAKKRGGMRMLQVAMFLLRRRPGKASKAPALKEAVVSSKGTWKSLVGSMRPLHLQGRNQSPLCNAHNTSIFEIATLKSPTGSEKYEDVLPPPMSPAHATVVNMSRATSEEGMQSRYASAVNLQELDKEEEEEGEGAKTYGGDDQIDAKAEEFIAKFYRQMKLQRSDSIVPMRSIAN